MQGLPGILHKDDLQLDHLGGESRRKYAKCRLTPGTTPGVVFGIRSLGLRSEDLGAVVWSLAIDDQDLGI